MNSTYFLLIEKVPTALQLLVELSIAVGWKVNMDVVYEVLYLDVPNFP